MIDDQTVVAAHKLTKVYGSGPAAVRALSGVDLQIQRGAFTAIMGASGSGKSTLMHCLAGLDSATSGSVILEGADLTRMSDAHLTKLRRENVGFIFQSFNLVPSLTALENIMLPSAIARKDVNTRHLDAVIDALGLRDRLDHQPPHLSGGQAQKVACARALVTRPAVIFADEPTGNLDSEAGDQVLHVLRKAVDQFHQTVVLVTHSTAAALWSDRVIFLKDGKVAGDLEQPTQDALAEALNNLETEATAKPPTRRLRPAPSRHQPVEPPTQDPDEELPVSLDDIAPPRSLPAEQEEIITRAQKILSTLPGPVTGQDTP